jgi:cytochrome c-type biogenesis protein CcmE
MDRNRRFIIGACIIVAAVSYLVFTGIRETSVYYFTIDEFLLQRDAMAQEDVRVAGRVGVETVDWNPTTLDLRFELGDFAGGDGVPVTYNGILPDMFAEGRDVIVEGTFVGGTLEAHTLLTSCPSKYEAEVPEG